MRMPPDGKGEKTLMAAFVTVVTLHHTLPKQEYIKEFGTPKAG